MSSSTATQTLPSQPPHPRTVTSALAAADRWRTPAQAPGILAALPEGATLVATVPPSALPQDLLARFGAQPGATDRPLVGYLLLVAAEKAEPVPDTRGVHVDTDRRIASVDGEPLELTYLEFELLAHLTTHPHRVHTRDHLVSVVWGYGHPGDGRTVDVHVARLRRKLGPAHRDGIVTVRRVGYKYVPFG